MIVVTLIAQLPLTTGSVDFLGFFEACKLRVSKKRIKYAGHITSL